MNETELTTILGSVLALVAAFIITATKRWLNKRGLMSVEAAYILDFNRILFLKLKLDWKDLPLTEKLDRLKALMDLIYAFDKLEPEPSKMSIDKISSTIDKLNEISFD